MRIRHLLGLALLAVLLPAPIRAQEAPEQLLSAGTQVYIRWDGLTAHQADNAKTALGQMLAGDTGVFLKNVFGQVQEGIGTLLTVEQLLGGVPPEKLQQLQADGAEAAKLLPLLGDTGFILAGELRKLEPFDGDLTLIVPNVGEKSKSLFSSLRLIVTLGKGQIKEQRFGKRVVFHIEPPEDVPVHLSWWLEGNHAILHLGTEPPEALMKRWDSKTRARLPENALYKRVQGFNQFTTSARAFVDIAALVKLAGTRGPEVVKLLDELGVNSLKSLVLYSGFAGEAQRDLVELEIPGPRKGILGLFRGKAFTLADVPALPPDVLTFSMATFEAATFYDVALQVAETVAKVVSPDAVPFVKGAPAVVNLSLGLDLRRDLLAALGDQVINYSAPSEGPLTLGQVVMFKVKDGDKVKESLEQIIKAISRLTGADLQLKKHTYRGAEVRELRVRTQGFFFVPSYTIHKGWLCIAMFPQPVHGYIARSNGDLAAWKPSPKVRALLDELPKEVVSLSYSDPRTSITQIMSLGPVIGGLVTSFYPESSFQVGTIPNAQEVTRFLFPNVSVGTVDDRFLRLESRTSLPLPFDVAGVDTYAIFIFFSFGAFRAF